MDEPLKDSLDATSLAERGEVRAAAFVLGFLMAAHALLETGRDALFLRSLPSTYLPWVYLLIALLAFAVTRHERKVSHGRERRGVLPAMITASSVVTAILWLLCEWPNMALLMALYVWSGVYATLMTVQFWLSLSSRYTVTQAKRRFGTAAAGGIGGAIAGSVAARAMAGNVETRHMVLLAALCMLTAAPLAFWVLGKRAPMHTRESQVEPLRSDFKAVGRTPYLRRLTLLVVVATMSSTLANFLFKHQVSQTVAREELSVFFATTYVLVNAGGLLIQLFVVGWLLDRFGAHRALCVLPFFLLFGGGAFAAGTGLAAALVLQGADGTLKHSVYRTALEVLYVPIRPSLRPAAMSVADVLGHRGGQALASVGILALLLLPSPDLAMGSLLVSLSAGWIVASLGLRTHYLDLFRRTLTENTMTDPTAPLDRSSLESLFAALNSRRDERVVAAVELLAAHGKMHLVPALILHHPSKKVVVRCLQLFAEGGRNDFVPVAMRLVSNADSEVRAAALRAVTALAPARDVLDDAMDDETPEVRAIAMVHLVQSGGLSPERGVDELSKLLQAPVPRVRLAVARALATSPSLHLTAVLRRLATDADVDVRTEALSAIEKLGSTEFIDVLLTSIGERRLRPVARAALLAIGQPAFEALAASLGDPQVPLRTRLHIPRSLSHFEAHRAAGPLLFELERERHGAIQYKILRALGHLQARNPSLTFDEHVLNRVIARTIDDARATLVWSAVLEQGPDFAVRTRAGTLLRELIVDKRSHLVERLFRLFSLTRPDEDFRRIHRGLGSTIATVRAGALELLGSSVDDRYRSSLLAIVSDEGIDGRLERLNVASLPSYEEAVVEMMQSTSETISVLAAYHSAELGAHPSHSEEARSTGDRSAPSAPEVEEAALASRSPLEDS